MMKDENDDRGRGERRRVGIGSGGGRNKTKTKTRVLVFSGPHGVPERPEPGGVGVLRMCRGVRVGPGGVSRQGGECQGGAGSHNVTKYSFHCVFVPFLCFFACHSVTFSCLNPCSFSLAQYLCVISSVHFCIHSCSVSFRSVFLFHL